MTIVRLALSHRGRGGDEALEPPHVRLAWNPVMTSGGRGERALGGPTVRLAHGATRGKGRETALEAPIVRLASGHQAKGGGKALEDPTIRLAHAPGAQGDNTLIGENGVEQIPEESRPALLVAFPYLPPFIKKRASYAYRDWALDSGAYSAYNSGTVIDLDEYIKVCKHLMETDPTLTEIFSLDVINDWRGTLENTEKMWKAGVPATPTYHYGEPEHVLLTMAKTYPKVALGGMKILRGNEKIRWPSECFARIWPKPIHGLAIGHKKHILALPWHSVDATSWEVRPCKFGQWQSFGGKSLRVRGSQQNLRAEVEFYLRVEREARRKWRKEMEKIKYETPLTVRLAMGALAEGRAEQALSHAVVADRERKTSGSRARPKRGRKR